MENHIENSRQLIEDIFQKRASRHESTSPNTSELFPKGSHKKKLAWPMVKAWHVFILLGVAVSAIVYWLMMPSPISGQNSSPSLINPDGTGMDIPTHSANGVGALSNELTTNQSLPSNPDNLTTRNASNPPDIMSTNKSVGDTSTQLTAPDKEHTESIQQQIASLPKTLYEAPTAVPIPVKINGNRHGVQKIQKQLPRMDGYAVNTIYDGQAWISHNNNTKIVQVGDVVNDFSILKIEANRRRVVTSSGVIQ